MANNVIYAVCEFNIELNSKVKGHDVASHNGLHTLYRLKLE
jgi:hypothetical protein